MVVLDEMQMNECQYPSMLIICWPLTLKHWCNLSKNNCTAGPGSLQLLCNSS